MRSVPRWLGRARDERGATLVEFALTAIIFLAVTLGIVESARMIHTYTIVTTVSREGARWAAVRGSTSGHAASMADVKSYVAGRSMGYVATAGVTVSWSPNNSPGGTVAVDVESTFTPLLAFVPLGTRTISSTSTMIVSR
jgi:Flp pilus assembly protein TadG